ncbi:ABC transporter ATP-binding protein [Novosphingobium sp. Chol11]|uniref:ABC transporter transmembrane domain-containing protein n=1 Tax=Novosphingobium sp. Chol11 TaxID=1385763 RepID=UPI0025D5481D|nr:ABC transporter ATP-binding protein [Novosphingobium sp. Chol11]
MAGNRIGWRDTIGWLKEIVGPDMAYVNLAMVYGVAISLLSLATPISVQLLINSVANTALPAPLWTLSGLLLFLLVLVSGLSAMRYWIMAMFERRIYARIVAEITVRTVHAQNPFFADQNRGDLFNRYFDIVKVQSSVPSLVIGAFTIILQSTVGLVVTSFYHPFFLAFNALLLFAILLIWMVWSRGSIRAAIALSHAKHDAARWLESIGGSNGFYKSSRRFDFAMQQSDAVTATYVTRHRSFFRYGFTQTVAFLLLYSLASAALLALGGSLILQGQLSIGQLVAAELILSSVFYGVSQLGQYLIYFYELVASSEEISLLLAVPQESAVQGIAQSPRNGAIRLEGVVADGARFDFAVAAGEQLVMVTDGGAERALALVLKRHIIPERGLITIGGTDMAAFDMYQLRSEIAVLNRPTIVDVTIRNYMTLSATDANSERALQALETVGLRDRIAGLKHGLDTPLAASGYPLSIGEMMALKLANALVARPKVLMLSQLYDLIPADRLARVLRQLKDAGTTVLLCTGRPEDIALDGWMHLESHRQRRFASRDELIEATQQAPTQGGRNEVYR